MKLKQLLKKGQLFSELNDDQLDKIIDSGQVCTFEADEILFLEGSSSNSLYVIIDGLVKIFKRNREGEEVELKTKSNGDFFGELALIDGNLRSATVATLKTSEFFVLRRDSFHKILSNSPQILSRILAYLVKDIRTSSEKIFAEELARQKLQSEMEIQRHRALSQMVAGVAHEINTPLGIIKTAAGLITRYLSSDAFQKLEQDDELAETIQDTTEAANLIQGNIDRAHKLVESFKKTSVSQLTGKMETVNLLETIEEILSLFRLNARQAGITIEVCSKLTNIWWTGFPGFLSQILLNLLSNINRYAYPDAEGGKVIIEIMEDSDRKIPVFLINVRDFGQGMPSENVKQVFNAFFTTGRTKGGTGLGMAIVHNLVTQALRGKINIRSQVGIGTTVCLLFPQKIE